MYKQKKTLLLCLLLFCFFRTFSQISIAPTANGCLPGIPNATLSYNGPGPATNITWNFGDGSPTSNLITPVHSYMSLGTFTVTFSATINGSQQTFTLLVKVNPSPTGSFNFTVPATKCLPLPANFLATSPNPGVAFVWDFGDNSLGSGSNPTHIYNQSGNFVPILTVQNTLTGCYFNVSGSPISVSAPPNIQITSNPGLNSCSSPFTTSFSAHNSTSGSPNGGGLTYNWNFGNGNTSGQVTPGNITFQQGIFSVTLTCTDNNNCSSSQNLTVSVISPTLNALVPANVCIKSQLPPYLGFPNFTVSVQSSEPTTSWNMGDGSPPKVFPHLGSPSLTPGVWRTDTLHAYISPGIKTITITATKGFCSTNITRTINVIQVVPNFSISPTNSIVCGSPFTFSCTNLSTANGGNPLTFNWQVVPYNNQAQSSYSSVATNPVFTVSVGSLNPYTIFSNYNPKVFLQALTQPLFFWNLPLSCKAETIVPNGILIAKPTANFVFDNGQGCAPLSVTYTSTSQTHVLFPVTSYTWYNGATGVNSQSVTGNGPSIPNFAFTYTAPGVYSPSLAITTASGCSSTSYVGTITVVNPPTFSVVLPANLSICAGAPFTPTLLSTGVSQIDNWHIESDNGFFSDCVSSQTPTWSFSNPGVHGFTITARQSGCLSSSVLPQTINIKGPIVKLRYETNCTNKKDVMFQYTLKDVLTASLNFGDGNAINLTGLANGTVVNLAPNTYSSRGNYTATLTGLNGANGCPAFSHTQLVTVRQISLDFVLTPTVVCKDVGLSQALVTSSVDVLFGCNSGFNWVYDNLLLDQNNSALQIPSITFSASGIHTLKLSVKDENNCTEEITKNFRVSKPTASFNFNHNPICVSDFPAQLLNTTSQTLDVISNYSVILYNVNPNAPGNTTLMSINNPSYSPTFTLDLGALQSKTFPVTLRVQDAYGCKDSLRKTLVVNNPRPSLAPIFNLCYGQGTQFGIATVPSYTNISINFGNGAFNGTISPVVPNTVVNYTYAPPTSTLYTPTIAVTDNGGCQAKITPSFEVQHYAPASFTVVSKTDPNNKGPVFCMPVTISVTSTGFSPLAPTLLYYTWNIGNGAAATTSTLSYAGGTYTNTGTKTIFLQVSTSAGCAKTSSQNIVILDPRIEFVVNKDLICLGEPITVSVTTKPGITKWIWDFGDNVFQPDVFPNPIFPPVTTYTINSFLANNNGSLTIQVVGVASDPNSSGECRDIKTKTIKVIKVNSEFLRNNESLKQDSIHCLNLIDSFKNLSTVNSSSSLSYTWTFGDSGQSNAPNPAYTFSLPGIYKVKLTSFYPDLGCIAFSAKTMTLLALPTVSLDVTDRSCPGVPFVIKGRGIPGTGTGSITGTISPPSNTGVLNFLPNNTFSTLTTASVSTIYSLSAIDENGCISRTVSDSIYVPQPAAHVDWDTMVVIGQLIPLNAWAGGSYTYTWTPLITDLNCDTCRFHNPVSSTTVDITYTVMIEDEMKCSAVANTYKIIVDPKISIDVPTAFTPNSDGTNDVIYADGWGIRKLNYFRIYNRWGQLMFETNDLKTGWDGRFNGIPQNMETYVYQVSAVTYSKETPNVAKAGSFKLLR